MYDTEVFQFLFVINQFCTSSHLQSSHALSHVSSPHKNGSQPSAKPFSI